jgi:hypothetical protein
MRRTLRLGKENIGFILIRRLRGHLTVIANRMDGHDIRCRLTAYEIKHNQFGFYEFPKYTGVK